MMPLISLLPCPIMLLLVSLIWRKANIQSTIGAVLFWVQFGIVCVLFLPFLSIPEESAIILYCFRLDRLTALFIILTSFVVAASLTHSMVFFKRESMSAYPPTSGAVTQFYCFTALFVLAMYCVIAADNLGFLWVSMEATTIVSAPLVYFSRKRTSLEATWKYLIICSVGIAFALLGIAVFYSASQQTRAMPQGSLSIAELNKYASILPKGGLRFGFIFLLLGFGTKAGLFPLHNWLPDAHSEAPAPASAILSGSLLNCAIIGLWRSSTIMASAGESAFVKGLLLPIGTLTIFAASLFLIKQFCIKRLLAYSSIENIGLMAVAVSLGSFSGFALQAVNHSIIKVALFLIAGNIIQRYGTKKIRQLHGTLLTYPVQSILLLLSAFAVSGTPPFGSFISEWHILLTAVKSGHYATVGIILLAISIAFIALSIHIAGIIFGKQGELLKKEEASGFYNSFSLATVPVLLLLISLWLGIAFAPALFSLTGWIIP